MAQELVYVQDGRSSRVPIELGALSVGQLLSIGSCRSCQLDLRLEEARPFHIEIHVLPGHWQLDNLSSQIPVVAEDLEDPLQRVLVAPNRRRVPIPFELTRIRADGASILIVSGHEPIDGSTRSCANSRRVERRIDVSRIYFRAGVLLCAERLRKGSDAPLMSRRRSPVGFQPRDILSVRVTYVRTWITLRTS